MQLSMKCPNCGVRHRFQEERWGTVVLCRSCEHFFNIPKPDKNRIEEIKYGLKKNPEPPPNQFNWFGAFSSASAIVSYLTFHSYGSNFSQVKLQSKYRWRKRFWVLFKLVLWSLIVVLTGALIVGIYRHLEKLSPETQNSQPQQKSYRTADIGHSITVGDFAVTVHRCGKATSSRGLFDQKADGVFIIVELSIENISKHPSRLPEIAVGDVQKRLFQPDWGVGVMIEDGIRPFETINPGISKKGLLYFDVPRGGSYFLAVSSNGVVLIPLGTMP